ncbi:hypothetical protein M3Y94_00419100 [Aphelenchoides besseyi]|nr:hypothetical protein M3Y94_00419100 [Aphelenchoides besseyi]
MRSDAPKLNLTSRSLLMQHMSHYDTNTPHLPLNTSFARARLLRLLLTGRNFFDSFFVSHDHQSTYLQFNPSTEEFSIYKLVPSVSAFLRECTIDDVIRLLSIAELQCLTVLVLEGNANNYVNWQRVCNTLKDHRSSPKIKLILNDSSSGIARCILDGLSLVTTQLQVNERIGRMLLTRERPLQKLIYQPRNSNQLHVGTILETKTKVIEFPSNHNIGLDFFSDYTSSSTNEMLEFVELEVDLNPLEDHWMANQLPKLKNSLLFFKSINENMKMKLRTSFNFFDHPMDLNARLMIVKKMKDNARSLVNCATEIGLKIESVKFKFYGAS